MSLKMASVNWFRIRSFYIFHRWWDLKSYSLHCARYTVWGRTEGSCATQQKEKKRKKHRGGFFVCVLFAHDDIVHFTFVWGMMSVWRVLTQGYVSHFSPRNVSQLGPEWGLNLLRQVMAMRVLFPTSFLPCGTFGSCHVVNYTEVNSWCPVISTFVTTSI